MATTDLPTLQEGWSGGDVIAKLKLLYIDIQQSFEIGRNGYERTRKTSEKYEKM